jgi:RTX calcium-binding nonapeptide repeat (4 copies)
MTHRACSLSRTTRRLLTVLALLVGVAAAPGVANASIATRTGTQISIIAGAGETNDIRLTIDCCLYSVKITDTAGITAAGECHQVVGLDGQVSATEVNCGPTRDTKPDVVVQLGDGNDTFVADELFGVRSFNIDGGPGDDSITGGTSPDVIHGGLGNDTVNGGGGDDQVFGDAGNDVVIGGTGADMVTGGPGRDRIEGDGSLYNYGDGGSDTIYARDGEVDQVTCGYGADTVIADRIDVLGGTAGECESVDLGPVVTPPAATAFAVALGAKSSSTIAKLLSKQGFVFAVAVNAPCRGTGKIVVAAVEARRVGLGQGSVTLVSQTVDVPSAGTYPAGLTANPKYGTKLRSLKQVRTTLSFSCVAGGVTRSKSQQVTFRR